MTMTNDELRELADALERMAQLERYGSPGALALESATAYLRAQADAQPVAWMHIDGRVISAATMDQAYRDGGAMQSSLREYTIPLYTHPAPAAPHHAMLNSHRRSVEQAIHTAEHPSGMSTHDGKARIDASVLRRMLAIIDSLPAAPQAEPDDDDDVLVLGEPDILTPEDIRRLVPQAEPKREPLTARRILEIEDDAIRQWRDNGMIDDRAVVFARMIERAHGIGGSDAE